jgi:hypothetical protein
VGYQGRFVRRLPVGLQAFPLDATFVMLGIPSGVLSLIGVSRSRALEGVLPLWAQYAWSVMLLVGCIGWGIGIATAKTSGQYTVRITRAPIMIFGLTLVSVTSFVYAVGIILLGGWSGLLAAVPLLTFAGGTYLRRLGLLAQLKGE